MGRDRAVGRQCTLHPLTFVRWFRMHNTHGCASLRARVRHRIGRFRKDTMNRLIALVMSTHPLPVRSRRMQINRISLVVSLLAVALGMLAFGLPATAADNGAPKWKVWTYNPSGRAFKGGVPASASSGIATFAFPATPDTALFVTDHGAYKGTLLGDLTGKTVSATVSDSG